LGHGTVLVDPSIYGLVHAANAIRKTAQVQQQVIALGKSNYMEIASPAPASPAASPPATKQIRVPNGSGGGAGDDRAWEYWRQLFAPGVTQTKDEVPLGAPSSNPVIADLVLANRMLASQELGVLDAEGHVSVRNPANPNHYYITRYVSAGSATAADVIENDLDNKPVAGERNDQYQERFMHGEVYKARPDVMAIVHAHTPEILAFAQSMTPLRPVVNSGTFIADGLPLFDIRKFNGGTQQRIVTNPALGHALATVLGNRPAVLMQGHGVLVVDSSLPGVVSRAYGLRMNARIQQQAVALGGSVTYLDTPRASSSQAPTARPTAAPAVRSSGGGGAGGDRAWDYWKHLVSDR
jgi:ribulose-5-phosphate 4-epimerase/fuculose-1-phosphate aldolase